MSSQKCKIKQLYKSLEHRTNSAVLVPIRCVQLIKFLNPIEWCVWIIIIVKTDYGRNSSEAVN